MRFARRRGAGWKRAAALFLFLFAGCGGISASGLKKSIPEIARCRQLIVVTTAGWNSSNATVNYFERANVNSRWKPASGPFAAIVGRNGMAWGIGLHGSLPAGGRAKREGDDRAPAGVFALNKVFGVAAPEKADVTKFPYVQLTASSEGIDDSRSRYYNRVVDAARIKKKDWATSEAMSRPKQYRWGIVVEHNWGQSPGAGSCIFLHLRQGPAKGTSGCTALAAPALIGIIHKLDSSKQPLLVQLPAAEYERLKAAWSLP